MASKLKDLTVTKVDFVDAGDNKRAHIRFCKRAPEAGEPPGGEGGGMRRLFAEFTAALAKAMGAAGETGTQEALAAIGKEAASFDDKVQEEQRRATADEIWRVCWLFQESLCSIFWDGEAADKAGLMQQSLTEFAETVKAAIPIWAGGEPARIAKELPPLEGERLTLAKDRLERLQSEITKAEEPEHMEAGREPVQKEGAVMEVNIDKSKLTPEEAATLEALEKKAGVPDPAPASPPAPPAEPAAKSAPEAPVEPAADPEGGEDIYKGLHPAVKAELERLRKSADAAEERELREVAKKYEVIGKQADELVPTLKSLKDGGGDAYNQMIAVLDAAVEAVEKSGLFREIGKSGGGGAEPWTAIEKHADEIMKSAPTLTRAQAIDKACEQHPELVAEYESGR